MKHSTKYLRRLASLCCTAVLFLFSAAVPALAAVPERPANLYVLDSAGVLSEETEKKIVSPLTAKKVLAAREAEKIGEEGN